MYCEAKENSDFRGTRGETPCPVASFHRVSVVEQYHVHCIVYWWWRPLASLASTGLHTELQPGRLHLSRMSRGQGCSSNGQYEFGYLCILVLTQRWC